MGDACRSMYLSMQYGFAAQGPGKGVEDQDQRFISSIYTCLYTAVFMLMSRTWKPSFAGIQCFIALFTVSWFMHACMHSPSPLRAQGDAESDHTCGAQKPQQNIHQP